VWLSFGPSQLFFLTLNLIKKCVLSLCELIFCNVNVLTLFKHLVWQNLPTLECIVCEFFTMYSDHRLTNVMNFATNLKWSLGFKTKIQGLSYLHLLYHCMPHGSLCVVYVTSCMLRYSMLVFNDSLSRCQSEIVFLQFIVSSCSATSIILMTIKWFALLTINFVQCARRYALSMWLVPFRYQWILLSNRFFMLKYFIGIVSTMQISLELCPPCRFHWNCVHHADFTGIVSTIFLSMTCTN